jgi:hypothetical protein
VCYSCALSAGILRRSFHVDRFFVVHVDRFVRAGIIRWIFFVRGSHPLGHSFVGHCARLARWVILWVPLVRDLFVGCMWAFLLPSLFHVGYFVSCLLVGSFHVYSWIRSRDLEWRVLEGNFCTVES